jgi:16S rRNA (uracil1498-N3)-methyltransferase
MTAALFLLNALPEGDDCDLTGDEGRHAARARRLTVGESFMVGDGRGGLLDCTVTAVLADGLTLHVDSRRTVEVPDPRLVVVQALPKGDRAELAVETMTELGVDEIVPWAASRSITQWDGARRDKGLLRWRRTAREAAKQSRRAWVPDVAGLSGSADVARRFTGATAFVLHEAATTALASVEVPTSGDVVVVVGPEGGITDDELRLFTESGAVAVKLGDPVLRTSTAGAAALAALSVRIGRWS